MALGARTLLECGSGNLPATEAPVEVVAGVEGGPRVAALTTLHLRQHAVDWPAVVGTAAGAPVPLPTYGFEHRRYWLGERRGALYRVEWQPVHTPPAREATGWLVGGDGASAARLGWRHLESVEAGQALLAAGAPPPEHGVIDHSQRPLAAVPQAPLADLLEAAQRATARALQWLQSLLLEPGWAHTSLTWVTCSAVSAGLEPRVDDLVHAPVWGLLRSARAEHQGRVLRLLDLDPHDRSIPPAQFAALPASDEPELAVRQGNVLAPRLVRVDRREAAPGKAAGWNVGDGTVVITGGTGPIGRALARHLVGSSN